MTLTELINTGKDVLNRLQGERTHEQKVEALIDHIPFITYLQAYALVNTIESDHVPE